MRSPCKEEHPLSKHARVHFLTAYLEYLYDQGIKSEEYYLGDASRFIRFLLARATPQDVADFLGTTSSPTYRKRLSQSVRKFYTFARERLGVPCDEEFWLQRN